MEYILIAEGRLKVSILPDELLRYDIDAEELDYSSLRSRHVLESILAEAKQKLGFDTSGHKILLEMFPSTDGGCELFITKLGESLSNARTSTDLGENREYVIYSFTDLSSLLPAVRLLSETPMVGESSVWVDCEGHWFLSFLYPKASEEEHYISPKIAFLCEFGKREDTGAALLYLTEYASLICEQNALEILSSL